MFILRTRFKTLKDGYGWVSSEENKILGDSYYLVRDGSEQFEKLALENGWDNPQERRIFAFVSVNDNGESKVYPLHHTEEHYVMTASGKTFEKIVCDPPSYYDFPKKGRELQEKNTTE